MLSKFAGQLFQESLIVLCLRVLRSQCSTTTPGNTVDFLYLVIWFMKFKSFFTCAYTASLNYTFDWKFSWKFSIRYSMWNSTFETRKIRILQSAKMWSIRINFMTFFGKLKVKGSNTKYFLTKYNRHSFVFTRKKWKTYFAAISKLVCIKLNEIAINFSIHIWPTGGITLFMNLMRLFDSTVPPSLCWLLKLLTPTYSQ